MALLANSMTRATATELSDAFERLFIAEYRRVISIAYRILGDSDEAEDVAQDVFLSFNRGQDPQAPFAAAWLYRAAAHLSLNAVRARKRRRHRHEADARSNMALGSTRSQLSNPAETVEIAEQRLEVREVLKRLPAKSATVLALRYSGLSYAEVAAVMGCGIGDIGTLLRRAENAFRKEMKHETH